MTDENSNMNLLRPLYFDDYIGQETLKNKLAISIDAAKKRGQALDHILIFGPPGLGKTTIANIIANEMESGIKSQAATGIEKTRDLVSLLVNIQENDILFIDEIHRLPSYVEEMLYSAMEDFFIEIITELSDGQKSVRISLPHFTLIGATTKPGMLSSPLKDRFGIKEKLDYYDENNLTIIIKNAANKINFKITDIAASEISKRSRGTPRIALHMMKRLYDYSLSKDILLDNKTDVITALSIMVDVDENGLDNIDKSYIKLLYEYGTMGIKNISSMLSEDASNIEVFVEPYLMKMEYIIKTSKGRKLTTHGENIASSL